MQSSEFKDFLYTEIQRINIDKWLEGERINSDPGKKFEMYWVEQFASQYRKLWDESVCRMCLCRRECGHNVVSACNNFIKC